MSYEKIICKWLFHGICRCHIMFCIGSTVSISSVVCSVTVVIGRRRTIFCVKNVQEENRSYRSLCYKKITVSIISELLTYYRMHLFNVYYGMFCSRSSFCYNACSFVSWWCKVNESVFNTNYTVYFLNNIAI